MRIINIKYVDLNVFQLFCHQFDDVSVIWL